jgi:hypothetical protein
LAETHVFYSDDAIALTPGADLPKDFDQTEFDVSDGDEIIAAASKLAGIWKKKRKFTDTANFTLKCGVCKLGELSWSSCERSRSDLSVSRLGWREGRDGPCQSHETHEL